MLVEDRGYQEVVVTGVQISSYRDGEQRLVDLVEALLTETNVPRLRLTSIAPWQFDERLLDLWPNDRLCRHFHLSLQSGSTETLRRMRRPYTADRYSELLSAVRARVPGVAITTDVIVGFPGESEQEFEESVRFVRDAGFARTHVFPYSEREGTRSAAMEDSVSPQEKKERVRRMRSDAETAATEFARQQVGTSLQVLWERGIMGSAGLMGTSDNYVRVQHQAGAGTRDRWPLDGGGSRSEGRCFADRASRQRSNVGTELTKVPFRPPPGQASTTQQAHSQCCRRPQEASRPTLSRRRY